MKQLSERARQFERTIEYLSAEGLRSLVAGYGLDIESDNKQVLIKALVQQFNDNDPGE